MQRRKECTLEVYFRGEWLGPQPEEEWSDTWLLQRNGKGVYCRVVLQGCKAGSKAGKGRLTPDGDNATEKGCTSRVYFMVLGRVHSWGGRADT